jgi:methylase of polypeptide subunit release factors
MELLEKLSHRAICDLMIEKQWLSRSITRSLNVFVPGQFTVLMLPLTISVISHSINNLKHDPQNASGSRS